MSAILQITDGTTTIDLLNKDGFLLQNWRQQLPGFKMDGVWSDSPLADFRQLALAHYNNTVDEFQLTVNGASQNDVIYRIQELIRLLTKASDYWTTQWATDPVYIKAQATCEENQRYAVVHSWRMPDLPSPFMQPFIMPDEESAMTDFSIFIEHDAWRADIPGSETCVPNSALTDQEILYYLEYTENASDMDNGAAAAIDDMPTNANGFTAEMWVYIDTTGNARALFDKGFFNDENGWWLIVDADGRIEAQMGAAIQNAYSEAENAFTQEEWHHIAMTYDDGGARQIRLWVDGTEVTYNTQDAANGALNTDAGEELHVGAYNDGTNSIGGYIGWTRITGDEIYTAAFTPPPRCIIPFYNGASTNVYILLPMFEGTGATVDNIGNVGAVADGTLTNVDWGQSCSITYGRSSTCNDEVYVANKQNRSALTHVFWEDNSLSLYSVNLLGLALPYNLLPTTPAADDAVYFGIITSANDTGPFSSLVFDLAAAISGVTGTTWEYISNPAGPVWTAFPAADIQDNTDANGAESGVAFDTTGVNSVHWNQTLTTPWVEGSVNGVTGWWVRMRVTGALPGATPPNQQNRHPYTVIIPYVDIADTSVLGDIQSLLRIKAHNQSGGVSGPNLYTDRLIAGLRSLDRGSNFTAYINIADEQNPTGITIAVDATDTTIVANTGSPTGRAAQYAPAAIRALATEVTIQLDENIVQEYYGTYRVFLRGYQSGGAAGDIGARLVVTMSSTVDNEAQVGETIYTESVTNINVFDLGQFTIPPTKINQDEICSNVYLVIQLLNDAGAAVDYFMYDLILIPVDEWVVDTFDNVTSGSLTLAPARYFAYVDIDSVTSPKDTLLSTVKSLGNPAVTDDVPFAGWVAVRAGPAMLQANKDQRLWFFASYTHLASGLPRRANHEICHTIRTAYTARYLSMRGKR